MKREISRLNRGRAVILGLKRFLFECYAPKRLLACLSALSHAILRRLVIAVSSNIEEKDI